MGKRAFFGRQRELDILMRLLGKKSASLVVIKGRRRIGKSRLAAEFGKNRRCITMIGLPPEKGVSAQAQRKEFVRQMGGQLGTPGIKPDDWGDLFWHLADQTGSGPVIIILDEINWMGSKDPTFLGKLKTAWDQHFSKNPELILILSGSMSSWIEKNILSSTGFLGRISVDMTLDELPLDVCDQFWQGHRKRVSAYEKFKMLSVTGGVPRYLEEIQPELSAEENIRSLCFEKEGLLFKEFERIFSDLFARRASAYREIVQLLAEGSATVNQVASALGMKKGGTVSSYLDDLVTTGYVARDYTWQLGKSKVSKLSRFRLRDNYLRFYLKHVVPQREKILHDDGVLPFGWDGIMGLQFENLVLNNRRRVREKLHIQLEDLVFDNPYFQSRTQKHEACQIDYMIESRYRSFHVCEIKFSKDPIGTDVIAQVQEKINRLGVAGNTSVRPVLIHVNGVRDSVRESGFFAHILDFSELIHPL